MNRAKKVSNRAASYMLAHVCCGSSLTLDCQPDVSGPRKKTKHPSNIATIVDGDRRFVEFRKKSIPSLLCYVTDNDP